MGASIKIPLKSGSREIALDGIHTIRNWECSVYFNSTVKHCGHMQLVLTDIGSAA